MEISLRQETSLKREIGGRVKNARESSPGLERKKLRDRGIKTRPHLYGDAGLPRGTAIKKIPG